VRETLPAVPRRRPRLAAIASFAPSGSLDPRLDALFSQIAGDERLVQVNEDLLRLPSSTRRAIAQMVRTLSAEITKVRSDRGVE
jgi:hypothetical protein